MVNNDAIVVIVDAEREVPEVVEFVIPPDGNREVLISEVAAERNEAAMRK